MEDTDTIGRRYDQFDHSRGPKIYTSAELYDEMFTFGEFRAGYSYKILDAMCGAGAVGKEISERLRARSIEYFLEFLDITKEKLRRLKEEGYETRLASVLDLPYNSPAFNRIYTRFGIKNYPAEQQMLIIENFNKILFARGIFVLVDMVAPPEAKAWLNTERREKHKHTGLEGSEPHIPTEDEWLVMLGAAGLVIQRVGRTVSRVSTTDWVNSNQMTAEDVKQMNGWLLRAPELAKAAFNIRQEGETVKIDYPVILISALKA